LLSLGLLLAFIVADTHAAGDARWQFSGDGLSLSEQSEIVAQLSAPNDANIVLRVRKLDINGDGKNDVLLLTEDGGSLMFLNKDDRLVIVTGRDWDQPVELIQGRMEL